MNTSLRRRIAEAIDPELRIEPGLSPANRLIVIVILFSTLLVILETEPGLYAQHKRFFLGAESFVMVFFVVEYALRIWTCVENRRHPSRWGYAGTFIALLDLVVLLTMALSFLGFQGSLLRFLRLVRLLRIAKLGKFSKAMNNIGQAVADRRNELLISLFIASGLLVLSASALYLVEGETQPETYGSIPRAMWWAVATLTTVGYGDATPVTALGKFFASLTALTGIGLIAIPTGILASAFSAAMQRSDRDGGDDRSAS